VSKPQWSRQNNINWTINRRIRREFEQANSGTYLDTVTYQDPTADTSGLNPYEDPSKRFATEIQFIQGGYGYGLPTIMQANCRYAIGTADDQENSDLIGNKLLEMVECLIAAFEPSDQGFPIYDFSQDSLNPTPTAHFLLLDNPLGRQGMPNSIPAFVVDAGMRYCSLTFEFWGLLDKANQPVRH
jgi:hypothetical protein